MRAAGDAGLEKLIQGYRASSCRRDSCLWASSLPLESEQIDEIASASSESPEPPDRKSRMIFDFLTQPLGNGLLWGSWVFPPREDEDQEVLAALMTPADCFEYGAWLLERALRGERKRDVAAAVAFFLSGAQTVSTDLPLRRLVSILESAPEKGWKKMARQADDIKELASLAIGDIDKPRMRDEVAELFEKLLHRGTLLKSGEQSVSIGTEAYARRQEDIRRFLSETAGVQLATQPIRVLPFKPPFSSWRDYEHQDTYLIQSGVHNTIIDPGGPEGEKAFAAAQHSEEQAPALKAMAEGSRAAPIEFQNTFGIIEGRSKEAILVGTHSDSAHPHHGGINLGASDNLASTVAALVAFRTLAEAIERGEIERPPHTVIFADFGGHEGHFLGSRKASAFLEGLGYTIKYALIRDIDGVATDIDPAGEDKYVHIRVGGFRKSMDMAIRRMSRIFNPNRVYFEEAVPPDLALGMTDAHSICRPPRSCLVAVKPPFYKAYHEDDDGVSSPIDFETLAGTSIEVMWTIAALQYAKDASSDPTPTDKVSLAAFAHQIWWDSKFPHGIGNFRRVQAMDESGRREAEIAAELSRQLLQHGSITASFDPYKDFHMDTRHQRRLP